MSNYGLYRLQVVGLLALLSWTESFAQETDSLCARFRPDSVRVDTIVVRDTILLSQPVASFPVSQSVTPLAARKPLQRKPVWVMRTNLPFLFSGTPNMQLEWSLGHKDKWSFCVEGMWSWWTFDRNDFSNEIVYGSVELRRWLGRRWRHHTLSGWHLGLAVGGGYGDVEWKSRGYQGEAYSGFLNIGWQGRSGRRKQWAFDIGVGLGYAYVPWRRYTGSRLFPKGHEEPQTDHLMWQEKGLQHFIGTPHVNISIGYVFNQKDAGWRRQRAMERDAVKYDYRHYRDSVAAREKFVEDSTKIAHHLKEKEISLLPRAERKTARAELKAVDEQLRQAAKNQKRQAKADAKAQKKQGKLDRRHYKQQQRDAKAAYKEQRKSEKAFAHTPEGRLAASQLKADEKAGRRQAKLDAKAARKQAKLDRKVSRMRARIDARQQRNLEKLQRQIEKADYKYSRDKR